MDKINGDKIKKQITERIAPLYFGNINLSDIHRVFSSKLSRSDLERFCDDLVREKIAIKNRVGNDTFYSFPAVISEFKKYWSSRVEELTIVEKNEEREISENKIKLNLIDKMEDFWLMSWNDVIKDESIYNSVSNYLSSIYFYNIKKRIINQMNDKNKQNSSTLGKIEELRNKISQIEGKKVV
jgi:hypothetical protein